MKKIGIITVYDEKNYGNRLQNLAVQSILEKRGMQVESIFCQMDRLRFYARRIVDLGKSIIVKDPPSIRRWSFIRFNKKFIYTRFYYNKDFKFPQSIKNKYDYFIAGSDQIWNFGYQSEPLLKLFLLSFADDRQKICISPSIGMSYVDNAHEQLFREGLRGFKQLSCREKQGAAELSRITGRECEILIDPTLYITRDEWAQMFQIRPQKIEAYIFVFFLAWVSDELTDFIKSYAEGKYRIINPSDPSSKYYGIDPAEFVTLLSNAHMVFTDSFHVTAFSINFHVPFYVFNRNKSTKMTSRIESICELFHLEDRYIRQQTSFDLRENCRFDDADRQMKIEREKFLDYLDRCFEE